MQEPAQNPLRNNATFTKNKIESKQFPHGMHTETAWVPCALCMESVWGLYCYWMGRANGFCVSSACTAWAWFLYGFCVGYVWPLYEFRLLFCCPAVRQMAGQLLGWLAG